MTGFLTWSAGVSARPRSRQTPRCSVSEDVVIVGAGIAGLAAAKRLRESGPDVSVTVLEASDDVGGRIRSDVVDGFILDRGFQVFIEAYPDQKKILDYDRLDLKRFLPGALVYCDNNLHLVSDPLRKIEDAAGTVMSPVGTFVDKARVGLLRAKIAAMSTSQIMKRKEMTTLEYLRRQGFTSSMIDRFFKPFYQGVFLAPLEEQSSRMFEYLFRMFLSEPVSVPAQGMGAIPRQLAEPIKSEILLNSPVQNVSFDGSGGGSVQLKNGTSFKAKALIMATDPPAAKDLLSNRISAAAPRGSICMYYASPLEPPSKKPILFLNGEGSQGGIVNNMCFPSSVAPSYAPSGETLVSVTIMGDGDGRSEEELDGLVKQHMKKWWGPDFVDSWRFIKSYNIPFSQPGQRVPFDAAKKLEIDRGVFVCGDHRATPTVNGAVSSGLAAADLAIKHLEKKPH